MYIKKFNGESLEEIQERITAEFGPCAVVLTTRTIESGFLQQLFFDDEFEVTVGVDPEDLHQHQEKMTAAPATNEDQQRLIAMASMRHFGPLGFHNHDPKEMKIPVTGPLKFDADKQNLLALVGPSGVGKKAALTKLALKLQRDTPHRVAIVSIGEPNNEREEELKGLARMFKLEYHCLKTTKELKEVMNKLPNHGIFILDTPGNYDVVEIAGYLTMALSFQVLLVLSAADTINDQLKVAEKYQPLEPVGLMVTNLNENPDIIMLSQLALKQKIPFSFLAEGSDLKLAEADELEIRIINEKLRMNSL